MPEIYFVPKDWSPVKPNPFKSDGLYGEYWSAFIYDENINDYTNAIIDAKVYSLSVSPDIDKENDRLTDFIKYETGHNRNVIIKVPDDLLAHVTNTAGNAFDDGTSYQDRNIRSYDVRYMVHSTTMQAWESIQQMGALLSPAELRRRGMEVREIGLKSLLEPKDYSDYSMLDVLDGCGELVVNSRQLGYVCTDADRPYQPGVRIYFDSYQINPRRPGGQGRTPLIESGERAYAGKIYDYGGDKRFAA